MFFSIAIDGPSGAGKSTISKMLAKELNFLYFDTGALYRAVAYYFCTNHTNYKDNYGEKFVENNLKNINITFKFDESEQLTFLNDENITEKIRTNEISMLASRLSSFDCVRKFLLSVQRGVAKNNNVVMDGRDIATVVLPNANLKIFLTADLEKRAKWRFDELIGNGYKISYEEVKKTIEKRDFDDSNRKIAPLKPAEDSVIIDSTAQNLSQVVKNIVKIAERIKFETK